MAAKRSPILGYNHNVRFRGIVFHIQTEDSGIVNPHVFSHLFHGGVILSTRKLVYDAGSNEDAVKSLMQAQHKAVMRDLRRGAFDDKIDSYLADAPGLLPRESAEADAARMAAQEVASAAAIASLVAEDLPDLPSEPIAVPVAPLAAADEPSAPIIELIEPSQRSLDLTEPVPTISYEASADSSGEVSLEVIATKQEAFLVEDDDLIDATPVPDPGRAPTERYGEAKPAQPFELEPPPEEPAPPRTRTDVSAALRAIQIADEDLLDDAPAHIHSPALPSAPTPPGAAPERVGEYHLARKAAEPPPPPARPPIPRPTPVASRLPTPSNVRPPVVRPPTSPGGRAPTPGPPPVPSRSSTFRSQAPPPPEPRPRATTPGQTQPVLTRPTPQAAVPRVMTPVARPDSSTPISARPPLAPPRRPASGGGVVVSRPAVIVGGKGAPAAPPTKVRRAKDAESFGGDLISERSLDEVILAYLSEDNSED